ncbi:type I DNA topoisomerase, partial [bacterium]|nr:type I DNA topoisomerase [bacterium]
MENDHLALITYPRTDSIRMADTFVKKAKDFIKKTYGEKYVSQKKRSLKMQKQNENIQDAHECIRVIDPYLTPEKLKNKISDDYYKMYQL